MQNKIGAPLFLAVGRLVYKWEEKNWPTCEIIIRGDNIERTNKFGHEQISGNPIAPLVIWFIFTHILRKTLKRLTWKSDWQSEHISFLEQLAPLRLLFPLRWIIYRLHSLIIQDGLRCLILLHLLRVQDDLRWIFLHLFLGYLTLHLQIEPSQNLTQKHRARPGKKYVKGILHQIDE